VADRERKIETLRLPETCKEDLAEEEAEGVDDEGMMARDQACELGGLDNYSVGGTGTGIRCCVLELSDTFRQSQLAGATGAVVALYGNIRSVAMAMAKAVYPDNGPPANQRVQRNGLGECVERRVR